MRTFRSIAIQVAFLVCPASYSFAQFYIAPGTPVAITSNCEVTVLDMDVENAGDIDHAGDLEVRGSVINTTNFRADGGIPSRISLTGDWTNDGLFDPGIGTTIFNGTDQGIQGANTTTFYDLILQGLSGNTKSLFTNGSLLNSLDLTASRFDLGDQTFRLEDASIPVNRSSGYISTNFPGRLTAAVPTAFTGVREMPMGYDVGGTAEYRPVYMADPGSGDFHYTLVAGSPDAYSMPLAQLSDSICELLDEFFYRIETTSSPLHYGILRKSSELEFTSLASWNASWLKLTGSGPQGGLPGNNLGLNTQSSRKTEFLTFAKERPFVDAGPDLVLTKIGESATIQATGYIPSTAWINWSPADDLNCTDCLQPEFTAGLGGVYTVVVDNGPGCVAIDSVDILVVRDEIVLPNAFSPNGDNVNDLFKPFLFPNETLIKIEIFNRWGEKVHDSPDPWDGSFMGKPALPGVYSYIMEIRQRGLGFEKRIHKSGTLTLVQ